MFASLAVAFDEGLLWMWILAVLRLMSSLIRRPVLMASVSMA